MRKKSIKKRLDEKKDNQENLGENKNSTDGLLECVLGLNDLDIKCYKNIRDEEPTWTDEISEELGKDESTVHRSVSRLVDEGIIQQERIPYEDGGYKHEYTIEDIDKVARKMRIRISEMLSSSFKQIERFESSLQEDVIDSDLDIEQH